MTLADALTLITRLTYALIGLKVLIDLARWRDRNRLNIALLFGTLAIVVLGQKYMTLTGARPLWLVKLNQLLVLAHPYLVLRLVEHFRPVPRLLRRFALVGMIVLWGLWLSAEWLSPLLTNVPLIVYFGVVDLYAAWAFVRGAFTMRGVARRRMQMAALGSGLIGVIIMMAAASSILPAICDLLAPFIQILAVLSKRAAWPRPGT